MTASKYLAGALTFSLLAGASAFAADQPPTPWVSQATPPAAPLPPELRGTLSRADQGATPWFPSAPAYKTPVAPVAPAWTWTGFYLGLHLGGVWDQRDATITNAASGRFLASGSTHAANAAGGVQVGYNYAVTANFVAGAEADVSFTNMRDVTIGGSGLGERDNSIKQYGTVRGRLGYAWNNILLYGTGGFAWANEQIVRTQQIGTINNATPGTVETASATGLGWSAGAGLEWSFMQCWTARVEYLHLGLASQSFVFPLATQRINASAQIDTVRFGVNYKFN